MKMMVHWREKKLQPTPPAKWSELNTKSLPDKIIWPKKVSPTPGRNSRQWRHGLIRPPSSQALALPTAPLLLTRSLTLSFHLLFFPFPNPALIFMVQQSLLSSQEHMQQWFLRKIPLRSRQTYRFQVKSVKSKGGTHQCAFLPSAPSGLWCRLVLGPFPEARMAHATHFSPEFHTCLHIYSLDSKSADLWLLLCCPVSKNT